MADKADKYFGSHEIQSREEQIKQSSDRGFGLVFASVFALVAGYSLYVKGFYWPWWMAASATFATVAVAAPSLLSPLNKAWTRFGLLLFTVMNPIVLGIVFFICIVPIGFVLRLMGKDLLSLKWQPEAESYWIVRTPPGPKPESLDNQF